MRRNQFRIFTAVCVVVLLFAQFGALTHAAWHAHADIHVIDHASDHAHEHAGGANSNVAHDAHDSEQPPGQAALCVFDLAFGQVLGGVHACNAPTFTLLQGVETILDVPASRLHAEALSPKSRGPPIFL